MSIREIPGSYGDLVRFNVELERERFAFTEAGHRVAAATRDMFIDSFPGLTRSVGRPLVHALLDDALLDALGFPHPSPRVHALAEAAYGGARARCGSCPRAVGRGWRTLEKHRTYPRGYELEELGPLGPAQTARR